MNIWSISSIQWEILATIQKESILKFYLQLFFKEIDLKFPIFSNPFKMGNSYIWGKSPLLQSWTKNRWATVPSSCQNFTKEKQREVRRLNEENKECSTSDLEGR